MFVEFIPKEVKGTKYEGFLGQVFKVKTLNVRADTLIRLYDMDEKIVAEAFRSRVREVREEDQRYLLVPGGYVTYRADYMYPTFYEFTKGELNYPPFAKDRKSIFEHWIAWLGDTDSV